MRAAPFVLGVLLGFATVPVVGQSPPTRVPNGIWGGTGIRMTLTAKGAAIEYDCASGTIDEPLILDAAGKFEVQGTHAFGRGGPRSPGEPRARGRVARYTGSTDGSTMKLTVSVPELSRIIGEFTLTLGARGHLDRCG